MDFIRKVYVRGIDVNALEEFVKKNGENIEDFLPKLYLLGITEDLWKIYCNGVRIRADVYAKSPLLENLRRNNYKELDEL